MYVHSVGPPVGQNLDNTHAIRMLFISAGHEVVGCCAYVAGHITCKQLKLHLAYCMYGHSLLSVYSHCPDGDESEGRMYVHVHVHYIVCYCRWSVQLALEWNRTLGGSTTLAVFPPKLHSPFLELFC